MLSWFYSMIWFTRQYDKIIQKVLWRLPLLNSHSSSSSVQRERQRVQISWAQASARLFQGSHVFIVCLWGLDLPNPVSWFTPIQNWTRASKTEPGPWNFWDSPLPILTRPLKVFKPSRLNCILAMYLVQGCLLLLLKKMSCVTCRTVDAHGPGLMEPVVWYPERDITTIIRPVIWKTGVRAPSDTETLKSNL